jgi:hypothetical protein
MGDDVVKDAVRLVIKEIRDRQSDVAESQTTNDGETSLDGGGGQVKSLDVYLGKGVRQSNEIESIATADFQDTAPVGRRRIQAE